MAIHISAAPSQGASVVEKNLTLSVGEVIDRGAAAESQLQLKKPYPIFSGELEDVLDDGRELLKSATLTSWQYVVQQGEKVVALAEVADGKPLRFASKQAPEVAEAVLDAIQKAEQLEGIDKTDYELRLLRVPELYLLAVWLHAPGNDVLLPVRPFTHGLPDGVAFTEKQVIEALRPLAEIRNATPDE